MGQPRLVLGIHVPWQSQAHAPGRNIFEQGLHLVRLVCQLNEESLLHELGLAFAFSSGYAPDRKTGQMPPLQLQANVATLLKDRDALRDRHGDGLAVLVDGRDPTLEFMEAGKFVGLGLQEKSEREFLLFKRFPKIVVRVPAGQYDAVPLDPPADHVPERLICLLCADRQLEYSLLLRSQPQEVCSHGVWPIWPGQKKREHTLQGFIHCQALRLRRRRDV
ncbi:hypothetical protein NY78_4380 [Desulfovibrio sp. TomC]|nr:hypothetical protein NY78_4380 [Desulfovibrio sp. TomC]